MLSSIVLKRSRRKKILKKSDRFHSAIKIIFQAHDLELPFLELLLDYRALLELRDHLLDVYRGRLLYLCALVASFLGSLDRRRDLLHYGSDASFGMAAIVRSRDSAAFLVPQYDQQWRVEMANRVLHGSYPYLIHDVARGLDLEHLAQADVEYEFRHHPGIRACDHCRYRLLPVLQLFPSRRVVPGFHRAGQKPLVAIH